MTTILGLDCSSVTIGYAVAVNGVITTYGHIDLTGEIDERCARAHDAVADLLDRYQPMLVTIESPVARFAKAVIPQARVSGAILCALRSRRALWQEVPPSVAKRCLAGDGAALKKEMIAAAALRLGIAGDVGTVKGKVCMYDRGGVMLTEDEADAIGMALVGAALRVVTAVAAD